jgi:polar amino acid transport system substrate-binding protein
MRVITFCAVLFFATPAGSASPSDGPTHAVLEEFAPTGKLRVGVAAAPARSALFVIKEADGEPSGVTVDLGRELAHKLGVPVEFFVASNTGELVNATTSGVIDVAFMPMDDERRKKLDFGPAYFVIESTFLTRPDSDIHSLGDVDRPGIRVVGIANTATIRAAGRWLKNTTIRAAASVDEAMEMLRSDSADAFALTHDSLPPLAAGLPGSRILDGTFLRADIAIAVQKGRPNALAYASAFMEDAKRSGIVKRAFDDAGLKGLEVAPPLPKQ